MPTSVEAAPQSRGSPRGPTARQYKPQAPDDSAPAQGHIGDALQASMRSTPHDLNAAKAGSCPGCKQFERCTAEVICCEQFALFARFGNDYSAGRWKLAPRQPSAAILERWLARRGSR